MPTDYSSELDGIEKVENDFLRGKLAELAARQCPRCRNIGSLQFSISKHSMCGEATPGRRYKAGITIWCLSCKSMLSHLDGFCPAWAENVTDWDGFSKELAAGRIPPLA